MWLLYSSWCVYLLISVWVSFCCHYAAETEAVLKKNPRWHKEQCWCHGTCTGLHAAAWLCSKKACIRARTADVHKCTNQVWKHNKQTDKHKPPEIRALCFERFMHQKFLLWQTNLHVHTRCSCWRVRVCDVWLNFMWFIDINWQPTTSLRQRKSDRKVYFWLKE